MKLSIIVVNFNTRDLTLACLRSVAQFPCSAETEIFVVDNASSDDSVAAIQAAYPNVNMLQSEANVGFARANNLALAQAKGEYCFLLNSDAEVREGALDEMLTYLDAQPHVGALGPKLVYQDGSFQGTHAPFPTIWREFALITTLSRWTMGPYAPSPRPKPSAQPEMVDWITGAAFMVRSQAVRQTSGFDDDYFMYSEETDWCWRLHRAGWEIAYLPTATVMHIGGGSAAARSAETYTMMYMGKLKYFRKIHGAISAQFLRVLFLLVVTARLAVWQLLKRINTAAKQRQRQDAMLLAHLWAGQ